MKRTKKYGKAHEHSWCYVHTVWQGKSGVCVLRYCAVCGLSQCAEAREWGPIPHYQVDMRQVAKNRTGK